ncbi:MAG: transcription termination/antitermination protein NusG [Patescibacteria group bacterium]
MTEEQAEAQWYVIHTYSGHEQKVAETIRQRVHALGLEDKVQEILIPTQKKVVVNNGEKEEVDERIFPGYVLLNMELGDDTWAAIRNTAGVTGFVGAGDSPTPLDPNEVQGIKEFSKLSAPKFEAEFHKGDGIKITDGPFADFVGKVEEVDNEKGRVRVSLSIFGRETPVDLDFTQVEPL